MTTIHNKLQFERRYGAALRSHLLRAPHGRSLSQPARSLGNAALALGFDTLDLAHLHDRALAALPSPRQPVDGRDGRSPLLQAWAFFLSALTPIERTNHSARRRTRHPPQLARLLRERTAALLAAQRQTRREIARRKASESQLAQGARDYSRLLAQSRHMREQARRLAHQILLAQEEERKEISRELHDEVAQILAGINVRLAALKQAGSINNRSLNHTIAQTQRLVKQSLETVHRYARELRPALLDDLGLIPALRSYIRDLPGRQGTRILFSAFPGVEALDSTQRTVLYRVAQEALTNVARHAHAQLVTVRIRQLPHAVRLAIHDDGKSFQVERVLASNTRKRLGLLGMRERVEMVGGNFLIESAPGAGTTVRAEIPLRREPRGTSL